MGIAFKGKAYVVVTLGSLGLCSDRISLLNYQNIIDRFCLLIADA